MVTIAIGALEMVGINANRPSVTSVGFFALFVGWQFLGLFEQNFGMSYADKFLTFIGYLAEKFLAFIDYLRHTVSFQLFCSFRFLCNIEFLTASFSIFFVKSQHSYL